MKVFVVVCLSLALSVAVFAEDDFFGNLDMEKVLDDKPKMKLIYDCLLDRAPCGEYQKYKDLIPVMFETNCLKCSPKAKENYELGRKLAAEKYPKELELLIKKYVLKSK